MPRIPIAIALFALATGAAQAASFCVSDTPGFQAAYDAARVNGESSNTIRLRSGTYTTPAEGIGSKLYPTYAWQSPGSLTIEGGWSAFMATPCALQTLNPALTVIDGGGVNKGLFISVSNNSPNLAVTVRNLTFQGGRSLVQVTDDRGGGLQIQGPAGYVGSILVERCIFRDNEAVFLGGGLYTVSEGTTIVRNNLFVANSSNQAAALYALGGAGGVVAFNNNTIVENTATDSGTKSAALLFAGDAPRVMSNNIVWHNTVGVGQRDLYGPYAILIDNLIEKIEGTPQNGSDGNLALDPKFVSVMDYRLASDSPAINRGNDGPYGGVTAKDLAGAARITGTGIDLGAYESSVLLKDGFE